MYLEGLKLKIMKEVKKDDPNYEEPSQFVTPQEEAILETIEEPETV
jgi:hypothetical protein